MSSAAADTEEHGRHGHHHRVKESDSYLIGGCIGDLFGEVGGKQGTYNSLHIAVLRSWLITANCVCVWGGGGGGGSQQ